MQHVVGPGRLRAIVVIDERHRAPGRDLGRADADRREAPVAPVLLQSPPCDSVDDQALERRGVEQAVKPRIARARVDRVSGHEAEQRLRESDQASPTPNRYTVENDICRQTSTSADTPACGSSAVAARWQLCTAPTDVPEYTSKRGTYPSRRGSSPSTKRSTPASYAPRAPPPDNTIARRTPSRRGSRGIEGPLVTPSGSAQLAHTLSGGRHHGPVERNPSKPRVPRGAQRGKAERSQGGARPPARRAP